MPGFTLIELLVVVAIVATLCALLLPSTGRVLEYAKGAKCASNLKQIGTASLLWSADNDNTVIPCDHDTNNVALWPALLAPYLNASFEFNNPDKQPSIYHCPSSVKDFTASEQGIYFVSYRANEMGSGSWTHFGYYTTLKLSAIYPAGFPLIVDGAPRKPTNWRSWFGFSAGDKDLLGFYHGGKANRLFLDGHVDSHELSGWTPMTQQNWTQLRIAPATVRSY